MIGKWYKVKTSDITLIQFIFEGYEGVATVSTIDPNVAVIQILIMPDFVELAGQLLENLIKNFSMEELPFHGDGGSLC